MSALGMGRAAARADIGTLGADGGPDLLGRIVQYIPADIVAVYVAVFALVDTDDNIFTQEWIVAYIFLALTPFVIITAYISEVRKEQHRWPSVGQWPWFKIVVGLVAYAAWVFALPQTPALDWGDIAGLAQTLVLAVTSIVLAGLGQIFDT